jgi:RND superfamily putative drug exporter
MPIILMGVLFGLAMDYEVFLVSRIREDYVHGGDARRAIQSGFVGSAKVVTAAAIIMISVFAAFVPEGDSSIKPIALGLAVGVFVDAFIVRMTLVPAVLQLLGDKAWWMPRWLDRVLPSFDVEGDGLQKEIELADWPEPGSTALAAAEGLRLSRREERVFSDVSFRIDDGDILVVGGGHHSGKSALLLTIAGRIASNGGKLKVAGFALPTRRSAVRSRVAVARLAVSTTPVADVRRALQGDPQILAIDDIDRVDDPSERRRLRIELSDAFSRARLDGRPFALVVSAADLEAVDDALPTEADAGSISLDRPSTDLSGAHSAGRTDAPRHTADRIPQKANA